MYQLKRKEWLSGFAERTGNFLIEWAFGYEIKYNSYGHIATLADKKRTAVILPRHRSMMDILLEGRAFREHLDRKAYYIMKSSLPFQKYLGYLGGIPITRVKDVRKASKDERKAMLRQARQQEEEIYTKIIPDIITGRYHRIVPRRIRELDGTYHTELQEEREIIVIHPEGTRNPNPTPNLQKTILENLLRSQEIAGEQITFIPMNFIYGKNPKKATISFGPQIKVPDNGIEELANNWLNSVR